MDDVVFVADSRLCEMGMGKFNCVRVYEHFCGRVNNLKAVVVGEG